MLSGIIDNMIDDAHNILEDDSWQTDLSAELNNNKAIRRIWQNSTRYFVNFLQFSECT